MTKAKTVAVKELKRLMAVEVPPEVKVRRHSDYVTYTAIDEQGVATVKAHAACYADHMSRLPTHEFRLAIDGSEEYIDGPTYLEYVEILKMAGLVPTDVVATVNADGKPEMVIPRQNYSRHRVYATLCAYRWAESVAPMVYTIVHLWRERHDLPIWQILHYAMSQHVTQLGHSWNYIGLSGPSHYGYNHGGPYNLATSLAFPFVMGWSEEELHKHDGKNTYALVDEVATKLSPDKPGDYHGYYTRPTLVINGGNSREGYEKEPAGPNDVLNERWIPLFDHAMASRKKDPAKVSRRIKAMYAELCKADPELEAFRVKVSTPEKPPERPRNVARNPFE